MASALFVIAAQPVAGDVLTVGNHSFEANGIGSGDFLNAEPTGWVRIVPAGRTVGLIGETRNVVANTSDGTTWAHLQTDRNDPNAGDNPPRLGQNIGALANAVFGDASMPKLWLHCIASRRLNESTTVHVTASLYAVASGATDWTGGTLVDSAVINTNLANLTDGDPGSVAELAFSLDLDNAAAQAAQPGGDYWIVLANTMAGDGTGGQLHLDRISAQTGDATDPGPNVPPPPPITPGDLVDGNLLMINDNGGWCWYQDEKVIYDPVAGCIVASTAANYLGYGGEPRDGDIDAAMFTPATGGREVFTMGNVPTVSKGDDHNMGGLWIRPDGRYVHMYTGHLQGSGSAFGGNDPDHFYRITTNPNDGSTWQPEQVFTWPKNDTTSPKRNDVTYSNVLYMSSEGTGQGRLYNIARAADRTPNIMTSDDLGETWTYRGKLSVTATASSYSNGYFKFASNGIDRIDFTATEHHPRDYNTSIYHGYIKGGKSYDSFDNEIDSDIFDESAPPPEDFTPIFLRAGLTPPAGFTGFQAANYHHGWTSEQELDELGRPVCLFTCRYGSGASDHRLFYARFTGSAWQVTELAKMGGPLHSGEDDYTGIGAIHPDDPNTIYISTVFDPRDDSPQGNHEIFKGVSSDNGLTWNWTQITFDSTVDNLRPAIPRWDAQHTAVLWARGYYPWQRDYDLSIVGIIDRNDEEAGLIAYHDAAAANTTLADGSPLTTTGPDANDGLADGQWHHHTGLGNGATAYTANDIATEDAPAIRTTLTGLADGTYDVYAYFWSNPSGDWRIRAGFSTSDLLVFRRFSCQQAETAQFDAPVTVLDSPQALYRAYVGRRTVSGGSAIDVYVDDFDSAAAAGTERTAYDGLGVARVLPVLHVATGESTTILADSGPYASIQNEGSLVLKGATDLEVTGAFTNDGFLDLLNYTGTLPAGLVNNGNILDLGTADLAATVLLSGNDVSLTIPGYAGHSYQMQTSTTLEAADWQDLGAPAPGTGANGVPIPLDFTDQEALPGDDRKFYRFTIE